MRTIDCALRIHPSPPSRRWRGPGFVMGLLVVGTLAGLGCSPATPTATAPGSTAAAVGEPKPEAPWFEEVGVAAGLDFEHMSGADGKRCWLPEIVCGGVGIFDYDGDGWLDIYFVQGGSIAHGPGTEGNRLYRNQGDGTFVDVTRTAGVGDTSYGMGCACGDYDNDGDVDLYVTNVGPNVLYRNNGDGTFTDVSLASRTADPGFGSSAAFVDFDADQDLDLMIANYVDWSKSVELQCYSPQGVPDYCQPNNYQLPAPDSLYRNNGDGTFTLVSREVGLRAAFGNGLGVGCGDYNGDGRMDIFVANDSMANQLWIQQQDGTFVDESLYTGVALNHSGDAEAGMGVATVDLDHDGDLDLFMTHLRGESNTFYRNDGETFQDCSDEFGFTAPSWNYTGFGLGFADFDHDGHLDSYVANGDVLAPSSAKVGADPYAQVNQLLRFVPGTGFRPVLPAGGTAEPLAFTSRGLALGDLDRDGDLDAVIVNRDERPHLLRNIAGSRGHWVQFDVRDARGCQAYHARLQLKRANAPPITRTVDPSFSYCSSSDPTVHFGLGSTTTVESVVVTWPDGKPETFGPFPADQRHTLRKGQGR
ncbi:MAG: CRTAC1 family protein [Planctomycetota bacterium]